MNFYSTNSISSRVSAAHAIIDGLPSDNGLYMPCEIPSFTSEELKKMSDLSLSELAFKVLKPYFSDSFDEKTLQKICESTFSFDIPTIELEESIYSLELFHGPTLAFKDVGARFLARCLDKLGSKKNEQFTVLVATSGDTGSAVAHGFHGLENVKVVILYPEGRISDLQERQMTCLGGNIHAIKVKGSFDDCQALVKTAFLDQELKAKFNLTSANSINIARFLPQSVYYYYSVINLRARYPQKKVYISVPSGNYGNLTAGLFAKLSGLDIYRFIASSNANDIVPEYLNTGKYNPRPSIRTISNAMDVGNPSNFQRMSRLFSLYPDLEKMIFGKGYNDVETHKAIKDTYNKYGYILDPHGAVGLLGLREHIAADPDSIGIFLETAHPTKFRETVEFDLGIDITLPPQLEAIKDREKVFQVMANDFNALKKLLADS